MIGIGYRKDFAEEWDESPELLQPDFIEVAPENWMNVGGYWKRLFLEKLRQYPLFTHGLSLSIGSPDELDFNFLQSLKVFLNETQAKFYSEHLSFAKCDNAHLYDLLPIPFTEDAVKHVVQKIKQVQDVLERPLVLEIVSYYSPLAAEMKEIDFVNAILQESGCLLLLDVNNIYVNAFNHRFNPKEFIMQLPKEKVAYIHMAGHLQVDEDLIIDTHGEPIIDPVYELFEFTMNWLQKPVPVLLERDFNIPELSEMQREMENLRYIYNKALQKQKEYVA
ncbi:MAG: DUF692 domain-containing protein [Bacteroidetes bacterium]|jgi:uncharacterized protein (UPF0276 family)|nr:MAG: DUF692 domain-containing protein [Bacteroidota bacterium]